MEKKSTTGPGKPQTCSHPTSNLLLDSILKYSAVVTLWVVLIYTVATSVAAANIVL